MYLSFELKKEIASEIFFPRSSSSIADNIFLWAISLPLGILAGFVFKLPPFWIYVCLKSDQIIKTFWCVIRLRSGKWIKKVSRTETIAAKNA